MSAAPMKEIAAPPFELLLEMERRAIGAAAGRGLETGQAGEWVGVALRVGQHLFVTSRQQISEIFIYPGVRTIPGSKEWLKGLANIRGTLLPIIDLQRFFGGPETLASRSTRVVAVNHESIPAGMIVDEVRGFRRFLQSDLIKQVAGLDPAYQPYVTGMYERGGENWYVLDMVRLVESQTFLQAAE